MKAHMTFLVLILSATACMGPEAKSKAAAEHAAKADAILQRATSLGEKDGDRDEIVAELRKAVRLKPDDPTYHYKLAWAMAYTHRAQPDDVLAEYRTAIRLKPDYAEAHSGMGEILELKGDIHGAIHEYNEAVQLKPGLPELHMQLSGALAREGDLGGAILEKLKARELEGDALLAKGDFDGAIGKYHQMLDEVPVASMDNQTSDKENAEMHARIGAALEKKGDLDGAINEYHQAVVLDDRNPDLHSHLAAALDRKGDHQEAKIQAHAAEEIRAGHEPPPPPPPPPPPGL